MYTDSQIFSDAHIALAMLALRRTGGETVSKDVVTSMFIELLSHTDDCSCGDCHFVTLAKPHMVVRAASYWRYQQKRCSRSVLGSALDVQEALQCA